MEFVQIFVDEEDLTSIVSPQESFADIDITKTITFPEPHGPAAIGIKGYEANEIIIASLMLRCESTTPGSKWNFVSERSTGLESWKTVAALDLRADSFPSDWFANDYTGEKKPVSWSSDTSYLIDNTCGVPVSSERIRPNQGTPATHFWTVRKWIDQTLCEATAVPTTAGGNVLESTATADNGGVIAGSVVGVAAFVALLAFLVYRARSQAGPAAAAPTDWDEQFDESSGTAFWVNRKTGEFSWTSPHAEPDPVSAAAPSPLVPVADESGGAMEVHRRTGEFVVNMPGAVPPATASATALAPVADPTAETNVRTGEFSYRGGGSPV
jgi:hypothetical protein